MLLNRAVLGLKNFLAKDRRPDLRAILVGAKCAVATDGHILTAVKHTHIANQEKNFPAVPGLKHRELTTPIYIPLESAVAAEKALPKDADTPINENAAVGEDGLLYVSADSGPQSFTYETERKFPTWQQVIPKGKFKSEIVFDAKYLKQIADYCLKYMALFPGEPCPVRITIYGDDCAARFDARGPAGQDMMTLLMPMLRDNSSFATRPDADKESPLPDSELVDTAAEANAAGQ